MEEREYQIAYFAADWNPELVESTLQGLKRFVADHPGVCLRAFSCFGGNGNSERDRGEFSVYDLPDLTRFDGVLVQGNQIMDPAVREGLAAKIQEAGIPAVSIDCPISGLPSVSLDHRRAQYDITKHMIEKHGARRLVYVTGMMTNGSPNGPMRRDGFLEACREAGIPGEDIHVIEGSWKTEEGARAVRSWLDEGRPLPDAFICANDEMAIGAMEELKSRNIRIPEDVAVTGFDNLTSAELTRPRLSTVDRMPMETNYDTFQMLIDLIDGKPFDRARTLKHAVICSESCGCGENGIIDRIREKYYQQTRFLKRFYPIQDQIAGKMLRCDSLEELLRNLGGVNRLLGIDSAFFCLDSLYADHFEEKGTGERLTAFGAESVMAEGETILRFPTQELLPRHLLRAERFLLFYPLHEDGQLIGYLVLNDISESARNNLHEMIFSFLEMAVESVRKRAVLRRLNEKLDELYQRDALTGLHNRFGLERYGGERYAAFRREEGGAQILFVDIDDMKGINDRYGHEAGDLAIRAAARILRDVCGEEDFVMRYGGDEFLAILPLSRTGLAETIEQAAGRLSRSSALGFPLSLSVGVIRAEASRPVSLAECIRKADELMYETKRAKRSDSGRSPQRET